MKDEWIRFDEELPTNVSGEQIDILFGHLNWATYMRGMYTHREEGLRECLSEYKPDIDKFWGWDSILPTHWIKLPDNPK
tara:strand:+ start:98 stop:334 length:237 start_codon:yes stop_codon:yes gene_type:complete